MAADNRGPADFHHYTVIDEGKARDIGIKNLPALSRSSPEIIEQKKMLFDALPKLGSDKRHGRTKWASKGHTR